MAQPMVHHRGTDFRIVYERCLARLKQVFRTENEVLMYAASGTGGMEAAVANLCSPGERVCVVAGGGLCHPPAAIAAGHRSQGDRLQVAIGDTTCCPGTA